MSVWFMSSLKHDTIFQHPNIRNFNLHNVLVLPHSHGLTEKSDPSMTSGHHCGTRWYRPTCSQDFAKYPVQVV